MQKMLKKYLVVITTLLIALCFVTTAVAKKPTPTPTPTPVVTPTSTDLALLSQLPEGRPFQIIKTVLVDLLGDVTTLQGQIATLQAEIAKLQSGIQSEVVTITSTGGVASLAIMPAVVQLELGKQDVRFEITFVPTTPATLTGDSYLIAAMTSSTANGDLSWIGTNSTGTPNPGFTATFPSPAIATITNVASLVATGATSYEISQLSTAPAGTYYVKIIY